MKRTLLILFLACLWLVPSVALAAGTDDAGDCEIAAEKGDYARAVQLWERALKDKDLSPRHKAKVLNNLAWTMATCTDEKIRDGRKAVAYAEQALAMEKVSALMDTYAAALAEAGRYDDAVARQTDAIAMFRKETGQQEPDDALDRLKSYKAKRPWRDK